LPKPSTKVDIIKLFNARSDSSRKLPIRL
jgi:hypothetical protein